MLIRILSVGFICRTKKNMLIAILSVGYHLLTKGQYANLDPLHGVLYVE